MHLPRWVGLLVAAALLLLPSTSVLAQAADDLARFEATVAARYPGTPSLQASEFLGRGDRDDFVVLDVRSPAERAVSRIPGAIDTSALPAAASLAGRPLLVYCTIGMRSAQATTALRSRGYEAFNLAGGVLAWAQAGQDFVDAEGLPTRKVHVYGTLWNHLPPGYQGVW